MQTKKQQAHTVLLVEDDAALTVLLSRYLERAGLVVEKAGSGCEALERIREKNYDILLMDYKLPDMEGNRLVSLLKEQEKDVPFVIITGQGDEKTAVEMMKAGAKDYFIKDARLMERLPNVILTIVSEISRTNTLRASDSKYRRLYNSMMDAFVATDLDGRIVEANESFLNMLGYTHEEIYALCSADITPEAWHSKDSWIVEDQVIPHGYSEIYRKECRRKNGTVFPVEARTFLLKDDDDEPTGMWSIIRDITARKKTEEALFKSEEQFRNFFENCPEYCFIASCDLTVLRVNGPAIRELGFPEEEVVGQRLTFAFSAESREYAEHILSSLPETGRIKDEELEIQTKSGKLKKVQLNASVCRGTNDEILHSIVLMKDITEYRQIEKQLFSAQKMEAIGTLAGGIAHDFNNIITVVRSYSELLMNNEKMSEEFRKDLREIYSVSGKAATLTRQLLAFGQKQILRASEVNLNTLAADLNKMLTRVIGEDIRLTMELTPDIPPIKADAGQIEQVILNLVLNARDAMPDGGELTVKTEFARLDKRFITPDQKEGDFAILSVKDSGIGIPASDLSHIFEPFFTTKGQDRGTGLGLAVVYGIVSQHGGWISVTSEPGAGSLFMVYLPVMGQHKPESDAESAADTGSGLAGKTVLVVEDENTIRNFVTRILEANGFVVLQAKDAEEALELFSAKISEIDLLFCDVVLPGVSGLRLADKLLEQNPRMRVILSSGYIDRKSQSTEISEKNLHFLPKPYTVSEVIGAIRRSFTG